METLTTDPVAAAAKPGESPLTVPKPEEVKPKKRSAVRHTRALQRDRTQRLIGAPPPATVVARLTEMVHPATLAQVSYFHGLGVRARLLTLPVRVALVLSLLWRQIGSIYELVRVVRTEAVWWVPPLRDLTQQALAATSADLAGGAVRSGVDHDLAGLAEPLVSSAAPPVAGGGLGPGPRYGGPDCRWVDLGRPAAQDRLAAGRGEGPVGGADAGRAGFGLALALAGLVRCRPQRP